MKLRLLGPVLVGALTGIFLGPAARGADAEAEALMRKNEEARKIPGLSAKATLTVGSPGAATKVKSFSWWRKLQADGARMNTLTRFHTPAEIRGEAILFLEHEGGANDVFIYLPAFKKTRRVESRSQSQSFMGSSFSYSDFSPPHADEFRHRLLKTEPCPGEKESKCFQIESIPAADEVRLKTGYSKTVQWIHEKRYLPVRAEFHGEEGTVTKALEARDFREVDTAAGKWFAHFVRVEEVATKRFTELIFTEVKREPALSDSVFTQQNLMRE